MILHAVEPETSLNDSIDVPTLSEDSDNDVHDKVPDSRPNAKPKETLSKGKSFTKKLCTKSRAKMNVNKSVRNLATDSFECFNKSCSWWNGLSPPGLSRSDIVYSEIPIYRCNLCEDTYICELCRDHGIHKKHRSKLTPYRE